MRKKKQNAEIEFLPQNILKAYFDRTLLVVY